MGITNLGAVGISAGGAYNSETVYKKYKVVSANGGSYMYINPTPAAGVPVTETSHWQQIAEKGLKGDPGLNGSAVPIDDASTAADRVLSASYIKGQLSAIDAQLASIGIGKLDFTIPGTNLFDKSTVGFGYLNSSGVFIADAGYLTSDYIPVEAQSDYIIKMARHVAYYNDSKSFILRDAIGSPYTDVVRTTPDLTAYIRFTWVVSALSVDEQIVNAGTELLPYSPYNPLIIPFSLIEEMPDASIGIEKLDFLAPGTDLIPKSVVEPFNSDDIEDGEIGIEKLDFFVRGTNIFDKSAVTLNYYIKPYTGILLYAEDFATSDYIPVDEETDYIIKSIRQYAFYDSSKTYISGAVASPSSNLAITAPTGAAFLRFSYHVPTLSLDNQMGNEGTVLLPYEPYKRTIDREYILPDSLTGQCYDSIPSTVYIDTANPIKIYFRNVLSLPKLTLWVGETEGLSTKYFDDLIEIGASEAGTRTLNWKIYDDNYVLIKSGSISVVAKAASNAVNATALFIGDSTIAQNYETQGVLDLYGAQSKTLALLGTNGTSPNLHEGRSGWTATQYATLGNYETTTNAFYNPAVERFDFAYYMSEQEYNGVDCVIIQLGINDIYSRTFENYDSATVLGHFKTIIDSILYYDPAIKIIINLPTLPNSNLTTFTSSAGTRRMRFEIAANMIHFARDLMNYLNFYYSDTIIFSGTNCILDTDTDIHDNVHPTQLGYAKLAKVVFDTINSVLS